MIRIGVICPSEIAARRFLPALQKAGGIKFSGIASASREEFAGASDEVIAKERSKAESIVAQHGGKVFGSYRELIESDEVDAIYLPLPPGLHHKWARLALEHGKHILVEKPCTTSLRDTEELLSMAAERGLAVHENYMFVFHSQIDAINQVLDSGEIGDVRLYRISFGFPRRQQNDFRYNKGLGGGALLDCGGYTLKYASALLGPTARIAYSQLNNIDGFDIDMHGSAALVNDEGVTAQVAFGMDNDYRCELEAWCSNGTLRTGRVLTAPAGFAPTLTISRNGQTEERMLPADDAFLKSIQHFALCVHDAKVRKGNYETLLTQARLVSDFASMSNHSTQD